MSLKRVKKAIDMAYLVNKNYVCIGGGEPTLHPDFFKIIRYAMDRFEMVWMATNGSQTKVMMRLSDIIFGADFERCAVGSPKPFTKNNITVCLSTDAFHSKIDDCVLQMWKSSQKYSDKFELRNVARDYEKLSKMGRAFQNGLGKTSHCICSSVFVSSSGKIKLCGCPTSPVIGDVETGFIPEWETITKLSEKASGVDNTCYKDIKYYIQTFSKDLSRRM